MNRRRLKPSVFSDDRHRLATDVMENGASAEIAVVGNEGVVGISLFMGGESTPSRAVVQSAGIGLRLRAPVMKEDSIVPALYCISCCATPRR